MNSRIFKSIIILFVMLGFGFQNYTTNHNPSYRYRKYRHVKKFYQRLAMPVTKLCVEHKVPPGIVLSILSLESGWGKGYVGNITGNFLSLNAVRTDAELPALTLPKNKESGKYIIDTQILLKTPKEHIEWKKRPASLKKDYRPKDIAGTVDNLDYFLHHPKELTEANLKNVTDFVSRFISKNSRIKAYREARMLLDDEIEKHGIEVLFSDDLNKKFVNTIGGKPNSYNFRPTWPVKVLNIYKHVGANELAKQLYLQNKQFNEAW